MSKTLTSPLMRLLGLALILAICVAGLTSLPTHAQTPTNWLLNPSFDQAATARGNVDGEVPINWEVWSVERIYSETDEFWSHVRSDPSTWNLRRDFAAFTGGGYQIVTVQPDKAYRFSIFAYIWTCNNTGNACVLETGGFSQPESGGKVRVGIDPTGGRDANSANIIWSNFAAPHPNHPPNQKIPYEMVSVDARSTGTQMTVFTYFTTQAAMRWNEVRFDDASLVEISAVGVPVVGTAVPGATTVAPPAPTSQFVPFVVPQQAQADGSLVHTVSAGDTLSSILFAYSEYGVTRQDLLTYNDWRFEPQFIVIGDRIVILPPGSIDPATGNLLSGGSAGTTLVAPTQAAAGTTPVATSAAPAATAGVSFEVVTDAPSTDATTPPPAETPATPEATTPPVAAAPVDRAAVQVIDNFLPAGSLPH